MRRVFSSCLLMSLLGILSVTSTHAQPCIDVRIEGSIDNAIVDVCADEILLSADAGELFTSWFNAGGTLQLYVLTDDKSGIESTVSITTELDSSANTLTIIPESPLPIHRNESPEPINYQLVLRCDETDSTSLVFWKQHVFRATSEARSLVDSVDISDLVAVVPFVETTFFVRDGCLISADRETGGWEFDHWTVDDPNVRVDHRAPDQRIDDSCWPLENAVTFMAWYRPTTASIGEESRKPRLTVHQDKVIVQRVINRRTHVSIRDIRGSMVERFAVSPGNVHVLQRELPSGFYVLVIEQQENPSVIPFIVSPY